MRTNKPFQEHWFVPSGAMKRTGDLAATGNSVNLNDAELAVMSADPWSATRSAGNFLVGGETATQVNRVQLVQGTSKSADTSYHLGFDGLVEGPFLISPEIKRGEITSVYCELEPVGSYSCELFSSLPAPVIASTYRILPVLKSVRNDRDFTHNEDILGPIEVVTDATAIPGDDTDWVILSLLDKFNLYSKHVVNPVPTKVSGNKPMMGFALDISGGAGTALGTLAVGDTIDFVTYNSVTTSWTVDADFLATVNNLITNTAVTASTTVEVIDVTAAGSSAADAFVLFGTDDAMGIAHDDIYGTKVTMNAELEGAFLDTNNVPLYTKTAGSGASEDQASARILQIRFDNNGRLQVNNSIAGHTDTLIQAPSYIDASKSYNAQIIDLYNVDAISNTGIHHQTRIWILTERADNSAAVQAKGWVRITDNSNIGLDTFTINGTALVEATDFAGGANAAATAVALAAAADAISGVDCVADNEYVFITATTAGTAGNSIANVYTDSGSGVSAVVSGAVLSGGLAAAAGSTGVTTVASDQILVNDLNAVLGVWLASDTTSTVEYLGSATSSVPFC